MRDRQRPYRSLAMAAGSGLLALAALFVASAADRRAQAAFPWWGHKHHHAHAQPACPPMVGEGAWYWMRSPETERQVVMGLYNRYCIRCHGIDGRGVWDIPGVPDFTNALWQGAHSEPDLVHSIVEGRGGVMPPFRGTLTLEEAWAMARYLRTFVPGTEVPRPTYTAPAAQPGAGAVAPASGTTTPPAPPVNPRGPFGG